MKAPIFYIFYRKSIVFIRAASSVFILLVGLLNVRGQNFSPIFPPGHFSTDGNSVSIIPFTGSSNSVRFQQVFDAEGFIAQGGNAPYLIRSISFREDEARQRFFFSHFPDFQINLSTTSRSIDGLSPIFSENVGVDDTSIIPRGPFELGVRSGPSFGVIINLPRPFLYDPSQGNLLLDVRNFGGGGTAWADGGFGPAYIDASNVVGDRVSSVFGTVNALSGNTSSMGLVTQFEITLVPEPSTLALFGIGLGALVLTWKRTRKG
jgi:hypothetical protein